MIWFWECDRLELSFTEVCGLERSDACIRAVRFISYRERSDLYVHEHKKEKQRVTPCRAGRLRQLHGVK